jgi:predicted nuclease of predicted toxin-antitoxin system
MSPGIPMLLLDQGIPTDAAQFLCSMGIDCLHVSELGLFSASDTEILHYAQLNARVIVTIDADFHTILMMNQHQSPSVIRIRLQGLDGQETASLLHPLVQQYSKELLAGCMLTVKQRKTTCHLLSR